MTEPGEANEWLKGASPETMIGVRGRAAFIVLGCAKNQVEAESMSSRLAQAGWELTADIPNASVLVVHTCGFLKAARDEALSTIREIRKAAPRSFLVMTGCFAQYLNKKALPGVDAVLGTGEFHRLPEVMAGRAEMSAGASPSGYHDAALPRPVRRGQLSAYLRISEGCDHRCSFCIIPQLRGGLKSRSPEEVLAEARRLVERGIRELVLISQDTTGYGRDLPSPVRLTGLLKGLLSWKDLRWIRLLYAYPSEVGEDLIRLLAEEEKLCGYLDVPLQHISDKILARMKRDWGEKDTRALLDRLARSVPGLALRTTFIVGFPGETEADFRRLERLVGTGTFEHVGVFPYSLEPRSPSSRLEDEVPPRVAEERCRRLLTAQSRVMEKRAGSRLGKEINVLAESSPDGRWTVRGAHQAPEVDGQVLLSRPPARPGFYRARVTGMKGTDLTADLVRLRTEIYRKPTLTKIRPKAKML